MADAATIQSSGELPADKEVQSDHQSSLCKTIRGLVRMGRFISICIVSLLVIRYSLAEYRRLGNI